MALSSSLSTLPFVYLVNLLFHLFWEDILELSLFFSFPFSKGSSQPRDQAWVS